MASRSLASSTVLVLSLNILFFTFVSSSYQFPPPPSPKYTSTCPRDTLKLQACANVLNLLPIYVGEQERATCCSLIDGLVDLEAALCLCTTIRLDLLHLIKLDVPLAVEVLLNKCHREDATKYKCPSN